MSEEPQAKNKKGLKKILWIFFSVFGLLTLSVFLYIAENTILATEQAAVLAMRPVKNKLPSSQKILNQGFSGKFHEGEYDIYLPEEPKSAPVLIFIPGGYWQQHNKRHYAHIGLLGVRNGFITSVVNLPSFPGMVSRLFYSENSLRKMGYYNHQQFLEEAFTAVLSHARKLGGNIRNLNLLGYDSGGFYVLMAAYRKGTMDRFKPFIQSVVAISPFSDLNAHSNDFKNRFVYPVFGNDPSLLKSESPVNYTVPSDAASLLLLSAGFDIPEVKQGAEQLVRHYRKAGLDAAHQTMEQATHQSIIYKLGRKRYETTKILNLFWQRKVND